MKCSIKNPHEMITETEGKAVFTVIRAYSMGYKSI